MEKLQQFRRIEDYFFGSLSKRQIELGDVAKGFCLDVYAPHFNPLYVRKEVKDIEALLNEAAKFYGESNYPWSIIVPDDFLCDDILRVLRRNKFKFDSCMSAMVLELTKLTDAFRELHKPILDIKPAEVNLLDWAVPVRDAFNASEDVMEHYRNIHINSIKHGMNAIHYVAYKDQIPISAVTVSIQGDIARIDDLGTLSEFQKKGYASSLLSFILDKLTEIGVSYCFLESSEAGKRLYEKAGFECISYNKLFLSPNSF